ARAKERVSARRRRLPLVARPRLLPLLRAPRRRPLLRMGGRRPPRRRRLRRPPPAHPVRARALVPRRRQSAPRSSRPSPPDRDVEARLPPELAPLRPRLRDRDEPRRRHRAQSGPPRQTLRLDPAVADAHAAAPPLPRRQRSRARRDAAVGVAALGPATLRLAPR